MSHDVTDEDCDLWNAHSQPYIVRSVNCLCLTEETDGHQTPISHSQTELVGCYCLMMVHTT